MPTLASHIHIQKAQSSSHNLRSSCLRHYQHGQTLPAAFRSSLPPAFTSVFAPPVAKRRHAIHVHASSAGAAQPASPDDAPKSESPIAKFKALFSPFSEPSTNKKLLALCGAQALSSVATLIHDTYLPLYLSEELKLSNTKASQGFSVCLLSRAHSPEAKQADLEKCSNCFYPCVSG